MRTIYFIPILASCALLTACESCNKKTASDATVQTHYTDTTVVASDPDTINGSNTSDAARVTGAKSSDATPGRRAANGSGNANSAADKSGYGAPDGTDAENHDGDQYTRNDATPKPTGPPIK